MTKLPDWMLEESKPVKTRAELDALPDPDGAWWRAHHARMDAAWQEWEADYGENAALEWDMALMSVFPQPRLEDDDEESGEIVAHG